MSDGSAPTTITCPRCGMTSHNPNDVREGYCGACHWWTSDPDLAPYFDHAHPTTGGPP